MKPLFITLCLTGAAITLLLYNALPKDTWIDEPVDTDLDSLIYT